MKNKRRNRLYKKHILIIPFLLVFCLLGIVVFFISRRISMEMSESAISSLSGNLDLISNTIESILKKEAEFEKLISQEVANAEDPNELILSYNKNNTMVKFSLILSGKTSGISNTGEEFTEKELDFSGQRTIEDLPLSRSYINSMGTWAYTIKCPVIRDEKEIATLYIEYIYDSFDEAFPRTFYNKQAKLYLMDADSERLVLKPKGIGEREAGHLNLQDFYYANKITEQNIQASVAESIKNKEDVMFYHDIQNEDSLIYMWSVNNGAEYLIGYVPVQAIQQEGNAVNQNIYTVVIVMLVAFLACCILYFFFEKQHNKFRKERELERERYNKQLKEALQTAQIANNSKTMFLSNMSHDIRTPMNAILGFATLLAKDVNNPEKVQEYTKKIMASGQHLLGLINDVLDISKIESGKAVLTIGEFTLNDIISSIDAIIRPAAEAKHQKFHINITEVKHQNLIGDETRINQILINLLSNAVKYTQEGGDIWLRIIGLKQHSSQFEHIRIEVEDNGYGMTPEYLKIIFEAFTRAENSTTNKVQGTGLGMAITKNIVELMGGTIEVASKVGEGSLFTIDLELRIPDIKIEEAKKMEKQVQEIEKETETEDILEEEHSNDSVESCLKGKHFLIVEDIEINAEILSELLHIEGASCEIRENGQLAVECFQEAPPQSFDAILMDVQMPVMNGYEASRAIRALEREDAGKIIIIAMTANAFVEDVKDAMDAGMNAHVAKPIDMEVLKKTISQYLK